MLKRADYAVPDPSFAARHTTYAQLSIVLRLALYSLIVDTSLHRSSYIRSQDVEVKQGLGGVRFGRERSISIPR